jgi:predicted amidophosphoribosyltransferase
VFCGDALDVLEAALFGEVKNKARCRQCGKEIQPEWALCPFCGAQTSAVSAAPQSPSPSWEPEKEPPYQTWQPQQEAQLPQLTARKRSKFLLVVIIWQSGIIAYFALSLFFAFF